MTHTPASAAATAAVTLLLSGCGGASTEPRLPPDAVPVGVGARVAYRPPALTPAVRRARPVGRLRCSSTRAERFGAHVELIALGHVVLLPGGVGVAPPQRRRGAYVLSGRCSYPLRTLEPTGIVEIAALKGAPPTLGELFSLWGQPLGPTRLAGFRGPVTTWVSGRLHRADPRAVVLSRHTVIVLEVGRRIPPHATYSFPPDL